MKIKTMPKVKRKWQLKVHNLVPYNVGEWGDWYNNGKCDKKMWVNAPPSGLTAATAKIVNDGKSTPSPSPPPPTPTLLIIKSQSGY